MNEKEKQTLKIYWANLCILNRMETKMMEESSELWSREHDTVPQMIYLGDTEEVQMYEQMDMDIEAGSLGFDLLVTTRFDLFCSPKYLQRKSEDLFPVGGLLPLRDDIIEANVRDPQGLFFPLVVLPHYMVCNKSLMEGRNCPESLEELLDPFWAGKVFLGTPDLPSGKAVLFTMWYMFGKEGFETCIKNWRKKSAPSGARHGLVKNEFPVALLPGVFGGPGPKDDLVPIWPKEGAPLLPSYAAVRQSEKAGDARDFLIQSAASPGFTTFYRDQAFAYPATPGIEIPEIAKGGGKMLFPDWEWILNQDFEYFLDACDRMTD